MQAAVPRYAMSMPTQVSGVKGVRKSKNPFPSEMSFLSKMLIPVCMNGLVIPTAFSRAAVRVSGAMARSASCKECNIWGLTSQQWILFKFCGAANRHMTPVSVIMYSPLAPPLQSSHSSSRFRPVCRMNYPSPGALCTWSRASWLIQTAGPCKSLPVVSLWTWYRALAGGKYVQRWSVVFVLSFVLYVFWQ